MTRYSIPFNGDLNLMEEMLSTNKIYEVYFSAPAKFDLSSFYQTADFTGNFEEKTRKLLSLCEQYNVRTNLLCNRVTLFFDDVKKGMGYIHSLKTLDAVTIGDPFNIATFCREFPDLDIQASVIMDLDSFDKIERALSLGVGTVNVAGELNRNMPVLKSLKSLKKDYPKFKVKLFSNYICYYDCIFTTWHYMIAVSDSVSKRLNCAAFNSALNIDHCMYSKHEPMEWIRRPFIRPEDIDYYEENSPADIFKLAFRNDPSAILRKTILSYLKKKHVGNLFEIIPPGNGGRGYYCDNAKFPKDFAKTVANCNKECRNCNYCNEIAKKVISKDGG